MRWPAILVSARNEQVAAIVKKLFDQRVGSLPAIGFGQQGLIAVIQLHATVQVQFQAGIERVMQPPVTPQQDTSPPVLEGTDVTPLRVSSLGGEVVVQLHITDDVSGRAEPSGPLDANPAVLFESEDDGNSVGFTRNVNRISASAE